MLLPVAPILAGCISSSGLASRAPCLWRTCRDDSADLAAASAPTSALLRAAHASPREAAAVRPKGRDLRPHSVRPADWWSWRWEVASSHEEACQPIPQTVSNRQGRRLLPR